MNSSNSICRALLLVLLLSPLSALAQPISSAECLALAEAFDESRHSPYELVELARACGFTPLVDPRNLMPDWEQCNPFLDAIPCTIDLKLGLASASCGLSPFYAITAPPYDSNNDHWYEAVLKVDLTPNCSEVCVVLEFEGVPSGWNLNLGDSATNNGYGGNSSLDDTSYAELEIQDQNLRIWTDTDGTPPVDNLGGQQLRLTDGGYKICVSNQHINLGQQAGTYDTPRAKLLYALPDIDFDGNSEVFFGLNRVIYGPGGRIGAGLRRASVTIR